MAENSAIEWADHTWSPWEGCTKVSPGCDHCYAEGMNRWLRKGANWGPGAPRREYSAEHWAKPLKWNAKAAAAGVRYRVFPSVCDPFDNEVDPQWRADFFGSVILQTPDLTWLLLTKRIGNAAPMIEQVMREVRELLPGAPPWPWPNVFLGATVVNQEEADRDIPKLLAAPARVHFISYEPALGAIDVRRWIGGSDDEDDDEGGPQHCMRCGCYFERGKHECPEGFGHRIDWVIAGGESGHGARPAHPEWFRSLRDQCSAAGVPYMHKQNGEFASCSEVEGPGAHFTFPDGATVRRVGKKLAGRMLDGRTHDCFPA